MKFRHFITVDFYPALDADIAISKKKSTLYVWVSVGSKKPRSLIFSKDFDNEAQAIETMKGFGHGFEYMGVKWVETLMSGELKDID